MATRSWPPLALADWADTQATLHRWMQIVGKVKLALAPPVNHWWHITLFTTARGLTTSPMPSGAGTLEIAFDFVDHVCRIDLSDGRRRQLVLGPRSVASFYREMSHTLNDLGVVARVWPMPVEIPGATVPFDEDDAHGSYEAAAVERWWHALSEVDAILKAFRGRFLGKCSPVHFFWGSFDLAVTRFSGRRAPERPGADAITREAYSHEVTSAGFWPGGGAVSDAAFYAYAAPEPEGYRAAPVAPASAFYSRDLGEFILPYDDVRRAASPRDVLLTFLQSTYEAGAILGRWDRQALERSGSR
jgi:hypothetical protein